MVIDPLVDIAGIEQAGQCITDHHQQGRKRFMRSPRTCQIDRFLSGRLWRARYPSLPNVEIMDNTPDIVEVYGKTDLMMPSISVGQDGHRAAASGSIACAWHRGALDYAGYRIETIWNPDDRYPGNR